MPRCLKIELLLVILLICLPARCQSQFTLGTIEAKPGQVASGFLPVSGGTDDDTNIPVTIIRGTNPGPILARRSSQEFMDQNTRRSLRFSEFVHLSTPSNLPAR
jgi:hypothetical protein